VFLFIIQSLAAFMPYTPFEIQNIQQLARSKELNNNLLAFELIRARGIVPALLTDVYWLFNRFIWEKRPGGIQDTKQQLKTFLQSISSTAAIVPLLKQPWGLRPMLHPVFEGNLEDSIFDLRLLAKLLFEHFGAINAPIKSFLFRFGSAKVQAQLLPLLKVRDHSGRTLLDLGGLKLQEVPTIILHEKNIQVLKLWDNELTTLPDFWDKFQLLEELNIAENQLKALPPSFMKLSKLRKLYAQNNFFDVATILNTVQQFPKLKRLRVTSSIRTLDNYSDEDYQTLRKFEELVEQGKINAPEKEQLLIWGLHMNNAEALQSLQLIDLFDALSDYNPTTRKKAKQAILNWPNAVFNGSIPPDASIAILGMVSFSTRSKLQQVEHFQYTTEINASTTHIVIGDYPENYNAIKNRAFIFMTEEDLWT